jgi:hypothetical protein
VTLRGSQQKTIMSAMIARVVAVCAFLLACVGCTSVGGSAVRTGPLRLPPHVGAVALFAANRPAAATEVGVVEVHAEQSEATIETLLPLFVQKVAALGGDGAVVDAVETTFRLGTYWHTETYTYQCAWRATCVGTRTYPVTEEIMHLSMRGRAVKLGKGAP